MSLWDKNYHLLKSNFPDIYTTLTNLSLGENIEILSAKNGSPTLKVQTPTGAKFIHSAYNPEKESHRFISSFELNKGCIPLIIGFGLGYHVLEILKNINDYPQVLIFEARPDIFKAALMTLDQSPILSNPKVKLFVNQDQVKIMQDIYTIASSKNIQDKIRLIIHLPSLSVYKSDSSEFTDIIEKIRIAPKFQKMLKVNFLSNLPEIIRSPGIKSLFGKFKNKPVFLISAGPSLARDIEKLKIIKDRGILICVSTVFSLLLENNIRPDFVAIGDPKAVMLSHFEGHLESNIPLIFLPTASKEVIARYKGPKIVALQTQYRFSDLVSQKIDKGRVNVGESVSTLILDIAIKMGANPIIFVGQDLAFTDGTTHAEGIPKRLKIDTTPRAVRSITGQTLATSSVLYWILHWIEKRISRAPGITFINVSQTGAYIKGAIPLTLEETIKKYCISPIDKEQIHQLIAY